MNKLTFTLLFVLGCSGLFAQAQIEVPQLQTSLVTKHTATWCSICGRTAWDVFENVSDGLQAEVIAIAAHQSQSSQLYSETAEELLANFEGVVYQPEFFVNRTKIGGSTSALYGNIESSVKTNSQESPVLQTGVELLLNEDGSTITIRTRTEFFQDGGGDLYLSVWLIDKTIQSFQQSRSSNSQDLVTHKHVLRSAITESTFGELISTGTVMSGTSLENEFKYVMPDGEDESTLEIATIVWRKTGDTYEYVNGLTSDNFVTGSVTTSTNDLSVELNKFQLMPNPVKDHATMELDLNTDLNQANIQIYNINGQLMDSVFRGDLKKGTHRMNIDATTLNTKGMYLIKVEALEGVTALKFVVE
ncbi:MAG: Omp28-related outer membrane protein [Bacteroidota bacterium]